MFHPVSGLGWVACSRAAVYLFLSRRWAPRSPVAFSQHWGTQETGGLRRVTWTLSLPEHCTPLSFRHQRYRVVHLEQWSQLVSNSLQGKRYSYLSHLTFYPTRSREMGRISELLPPQPLSQLKIPLGRWSRLFFCLCFMSIWASLCQTPCVGFSCRLLLSASLRFSFTILFSISSWIS